MRQKGKYRLNTDILSLHIVFVGESFIVYLHAVRSKTERRDEADNNGVPAAS